MKDKRLLLGGVLGECLEEQFESNNLKCGRGNGEQKSCQVEHLPRLSSRDLREQILTLGLNLRHLLM